MTFEKNVETSASLRIPDALQPDPELSLPALTPETLDSLREAGWSRVGLMVAIVDTDGNVLMLNHNGRDKNCQDDLGPLGETSQQAGPVIEQPLETLFRGIQEELSVQQPAGLEMWMHERGGWVVNPWPRGDGFPGEYACAISFPVFVSDKTRDYLLSIPHGTEEINGIRGFLKPSEILDLDDTSLRPGVKAWLSQLSEAGLLDLSPDSGLSKIDFSNIYAAGLDDIAFKP